jgi:hypothetical protein
MSITTFSELKTAIANWIERDDLTDRIPEFITLAEAKINDEVRIREMRERDATLTASTSSRLVAVPAGFIDAEQLEMTYSSQIWFPTFVTHWNMKHHRNITDGPPHFFTLWGGNIEFERTPDYAYSMELTFYKKQTALSDSNTTNDVLTNYPNIYLYASLIAAEPYMNNDPRIKTWAALYEDARDTANNANKYSAHSGPVRRTVRV